MYQCGAEVVEHPITGELNTHNCYLTAFIFILFLDF
jgi:hypothetical protein